MSFSAELPFERIVLYVDEGIRESDTVFIVKDLERLTGREVSVKGGIFSENRGEHTAKEIAHTRLSDMNSRALKRPLSVEVALEEKILSGHNIRGIIYDGWRLLRVMFEHLPPEERTDNVIAVTDRLVATMERGENRYHIRTVLNSVPTIVSTSGIVEGPARAKEYYLKGCTDEPYMTHEDYRMSEAVLSYILQTVMWRYTGDPFCTRKGCRLYNSHYQKDVIKSQVNGELCEEHRRIAAYFL